MGGVLIDTAEKLIECLQIVVTDLQCVFPTLFTKVVLFCDFEGIKLGKDGELCLGQFATHKNTFLIDFVVLGNQVNTIEYQEISLKKILEAPNIPKVIFDPRRDSMALYFQFGIAMQGVICLQLLDVACRRIKGHEVPYVRGLAKLISSSNQATKQQGKIFYLDNPLVWKERPLPEILVQYSVVDVEELIPLYDRLRSQLNAYWINLVLIESAKRVEVYKNPDTDFTNPLASRRAPKF